MGNHFHLLLETPAANLSQIMQHINGAYTTYYNMKRRRSGHLLQGRFKAVLVNRDAYAMELSRYIHLNPVRAGIVKTPGDYPWSSYCVYVGEATMPQWLYQDFILGYFGGKTLEAQRRYRQFVYELLNQASKNPLDDVIASTFLGDDNYIARIKATYLKGRVKDRDLPALNMFLNRPDIETIVTDVGDLLGGNTTLARQVALYLCHRYSGKTLRDIGRYFNISDSGVTQASRRLSDKLNKNKELWKDVKNIIERINLSKV